IYKKNTIIAMSLDSLIDAFDAYKSIHEDKDDYVILTESSGDSDLESDIDFENPIQALDNELLSDIQLKDHFEQPLIQLTKYNIYYNILRNESQNETTSNEEYIIQKSSSRGEIEIIKPFIGCNHWHPANKVFDYNYFQVDLSFKRVANKDINELEFNVYDQKYSTSCIIVDLDLAQAKGLGKALKTIDLLKKRKEHLEHIIKSYRVYFQRNIHNSKYSTKAKSLMNELINQTSKENTQQLFKALEKLNEPKIQDWISFYKTSWILALLIQAYTKIPTDLWNSTPFDTNIAESAHVSVNREGTKLKLRGLNFDLLAYKRIEIYSKYSISKTNKDTSLTQRKYNANKCKGVQRTAPIKKKAKTTVASSNYTESSKP
ncbi:34340_t:CDS:2, partial [Gigaspora margarita]